MEWMTTTVFTSKWLWWHDCEAIRSKHFIIKVILVIIYYFFGVHESLCLWEDSLFDIERCSHCSIEAFGELIIIKPATASNSFDPIQHQNIISLKLFIFFLFFIIFLVHFRWRFCREFNFDFFFLLSVDIDTCDLWSTWHFDRKRKWSRKKSTEYRK